jgi:hypothetical protein
LRFQHRRPLGFIPGELLERQRLYCVGIGKNHDIPVLSAGGTAYHLHFLTALPATIALAKAVQMLKGQFVPLDSNFGGKRTRHFRAELSYAAAARLEHFARQASRRKVDSESRRTFENWIYVTPSESLVTNPCKI